MTLQGCQRNDFWLVQGVDSRALAEEAVPCWSRSHTAAGSTILVGNKAELCLC